MSHILLLSDRSSGWVFSMVCESVEGRSVGVCVCARVHVCVCALACDVLIGFILRRKKGPVCQSSLSFSSSSSVKEEAARKESLTTTMLCSEFVTRVLHLKTDIGSFLSILFWGQRRTNFTFPFQGLPDRTSRPSPAWWLASQ